MRLSVTDLSPMFPLQDGADQVLARVLLHVVPPSSPVQLLSAPTARPPVHCRADQVDSLAASPRHGDHRHRVDGASVTVLASALRKEDGVLAHHLAPTHRLFLSVQLEDPGDRSAGNHLSLQLQQAEIRNRFHQVHLLPHEQSSPADNKTFSTKHKTSFIV